MPISAKRPHSGRRVLLPSGRRSMSELGAWLLSGGRGARWSLLPLDGGSCVMAVPVVQGPDCCARFGGTRTSIMKEW
jgi:hypothetical protein